MRKLCLLLLLVGMAFPAGAQEIRLRRGQVDEVLPLLDSVGRRIRVYLPTNFEASGSWPLMLVCDLGEDPVRSMRYFRKAAESNGYILAMSQALSDSISLTQKVIYLAQSLRAIDSVLPIDRNRIYAGGIADGGHFAGILPSLIRQVGGVLTVASGPPNTDLATQRTPFHYVGILDRGSHYYADMLEAETLLDRKQIQNHVLFYNGDDGLPSEDLAEQGLQMLTLLAMKYGRIPADSALVHKHRDQVLADARLLQGQGHPLVAYDRLEEGMALFDGLATTDALEDALRLLRRDNSYKTRKRIAASLLNKESILRADYAYYMEEDVVAFNLENLGWWKFQMESIRTYLESANPEEKLLGLRLKGYINALADDYIRIARTGAPPDDDALVLLYMLKTITQPQVPGNYLEVVSLTSKYGDFGTALFYVEELLKTGYSDRERLYSLEHTALLRITPEFNALIGKYLREARYQVPDPPDDGIPGSRR